MEHRQAEAVIANRCENDPELTDAVCTVYDGFSAKFGIVACGALLAFESIKELIS